MELIAQGLGDAIAKLLAWDPDVRDAAAAWLLIRESRLLVLGAAIAGFGAVISEIGASLMVGCNVKGDTRILTTAITLETRKGEFGSAFALAFILLAIIFLITAVTTWAQ